jgi:hypothetical protein
MVLMALRLAREVATLHSASRKLPRSTARKGSSSSQHKSSRAVARVQKLMGQPLRQQAAPLKARMAGRHAASSLGEAALRM